MSERQADTLIDHIQARIESIQTKLANLKQSVDAAEPVSHVDSVYPMTDPPDNIVSGTDGDIASRRSSNQSPIRQADIQQGSIELF